MTITATACHMPRRSTLAPGRLSANVDQLAIQVTARHTPTYRQVGTERCHRAPQETRRQHRELHAYRNTGDHAVVATRWNDTVGRRGRRRAKYKVYGRVTSQPRRPGTYTDTSPYRDLRPSSLRRREERGLPAEGAPPADVALGFKKHDA